MATGNNITPEGLVSSAGLPNPPRFDLWPAALQSSERLRGTLVPCGPGLRGVGWPDTPRVRLAALAPWLEKRRIAAYLTAAWVWGAARDPGTPLRLTMPTGYRPRRSRGPDVHVHELRLAPADVHQFGAFAVTSPQRTIIDMLCDPAPLQLREVVAVRLLLTLVAGGRTAIFADLHDRHRPRKQVALARLTDLRADPPVLPENALTSVHAVRVVDSVDPPHGIQHMLEVHGVPHFENEAADGQS